MNTDQFEVFLKAAGLEVIRVDGPIFHHAGKRYEAVSRSMTKPEDFIQAMEEHNYRKVFLLNFVALMHGDGSINCYVFRGRFE